MKTLSCILYSEAVQYALIGLMDVLLIVDFV